MQKYQASSKDAYVSGLALLPLFLGLLKDEYAYILKDNGVLVDSLEEWYPQQFVLDILRTIKAKVKNQLVLVSVGMTWAGDAPPEFDTFDEFLQYLADIYAASSTGLALNDTLCVDKFSRFDVQAVDLRTQTSSPGAKSVSFVGENHYEVINSTPYPDDLIYGYLYGNARRYMKEFMVSYRDPAKIDSDDNMYFDIRWKVQKQ